MGDSTKVEAHLEGETLRPSEWAASGTTLSDRPLRFALDVVAGPDQGKRLATDRLPMSIGSAADNDLRLTDRYASRNHCLILEGANGSFVLRDRESRNGTFCNGVKVFEIAIDLGAELQIGTTRIRFGLEEEGEAGAGREPECFNELVGSGHAIRLVFDSLRRMAPTELSCLLLGETGTGKELAARAIHAHSRRARGPFIVIDCGAVSETLIEDKLFGHELGAFTGALKEAKGAFEEAKGGTIFLDEIGDLRLALQPKLLRVLERREVTRLGSHRAIPVDVRVIAATHRDLLSLVADGGFRQDLYYRLAESSVSLPPLRNRVEDIEVLARHFLDQIGGRPLSLRPDAIELLKRHAWPGNVRELRNVLRRTAATVNGASIDGAALGLTVHKDAVHNDGAGFPPNETTKTFAKLPIAEAKDAHRKEYLKHLLEAHGDDHAAIARNMGVNIKYARRLLRRYGLIA